LLSGILAIALGSALKFVKVSVLAGLGAAFGTLGFVCLVLLVIEFIALTNLMDQLKDQTERRKKEQAFLTGSEI
jgi:hypothetical protein